MPRRGGGMRSPSPSRGYSSAPAPRPSVPARVPPPPPPPAPVAAQPKQPGMFAQMATTAAGVAVGSAVGHTISGAMLGGGGGEQQQAAPVDQQQQQPAAYQQPYQQQQQPADQQAGPCQFEMKQFLDCAQTQHDITLCQSFNDALRQCKVSYGLPLQ